MDRNQGRRANRIDWLAKGLLTPHVDAYTHYLIERGYAQRTVEGYVSGLRHFAQWAQRRRLPVHRIDEAAVAQFLDEHLPCCECIGPVRCALRDLHAGLVHLLVVLHSLGWLNPPPTRTTRAEQELRRLDEHILVDTM